MPTIPKGFKGSIGASMAIVPINQPQVIRQLSNASEKYYRNLLLRANRIGIILVKESMLLAQSGYYQPARDTGTFIRSISHKVTKENSVSFTIEYGSAIDYAIYIHEGTKWMEKRPMFKDAYKNKKMEIDLEIKRAFRGV